MKLCDTCIYRNNVEQLKPCIIYRDNCEYYEKERGDMTREEAEEYAKEMTYRDAINNLMKARSIPYRKATFIKVNELLKALEQEPSGETVSLEAFKQVMWERDIAIEQLKELGYGFGQKIEPKTIQEKQAESEKYQKAFDDGYENGYAQARFDYEQEPKTGHWKRISIDKYSEHAKYWYRCDRCGKDNLGNTDWCPNCGCRMVEPQESEDKEI